jgi:hypothetical protein
MLTKKMQTKAKRIKDKELLRVSRQRRENATAFNKKLADKVRRVAKKIGCYHGEIRYEQIKAAGEQYFSNAEVNQLKKIGDIHDAINLQNKVSGDDMLLEALERIGQKQIFHDERAKRQPKIDSAVRNMIAGGAA